MDMITLGNGVVVFIFEAWIFFVFFFWFCFSLRVHRCYVLFFPCLSNITVCRVCVANIVHFTGMHFAILFRSVFIVRIVLMMRWWSMAAVVMAVAGHLQRLCNWPSETTTAIHAENALRYFSPFISIFLLFDAGFSEYFCCFG